MHSSGSVTDPTLVRHATRLSTLQVTGSDRLTWLNGLLTCDVREVAPGRGAYGLVLNKQGKVQADATIVASADAVYLGVTARDASELRAYLDRFLIMEDAEVRDVSADVAWVTLHGATAAPVAAAGAERVFALAFGSVPWTGGGGAALAVRADAVVSTIGQLASDFGATVADAAAWARVRVELGFPEFGVDYDETDNPHEAALERRAVSWTKGCYLGQEVVCMQDMRGKVKRRVVALRVDSAGVPEVGTEVLHQGADVGVVTTVAFSDALATPIVLARLKSSAIEANSDLSIGGSPAWILERPA
jgi:hypothetical protein